MNTREILAKLCIHLGMGIKVIGDGATFPYIITTYHVEDREGLYDELQGYFFFDRAGINAYFYPDRERHFYLMATEHLVGEFEKVFGEIPVCYSVDGRKISIPLFRSEANYGLWRQYCEANFHTRRDLELFADHGEYGAILYPRKLNEIIKG
jgi:hypothetical protein